MMILNRNVALQRFHKLDTVAEIWKPSPDCSGYDIFVAQALKSGNSI